MESLRLAIHSKQLHRNTDDALKRTHATNTSALATPRSSWKALLFLSTLATCTGYYINNKCLADSGSFSCYDNAKAVDIKPTQSVRTFNCTKCELPVLPAGVFGTAFFKDCSAISVTGSGVDAIEDGAFNSTRLLRDLSLRNNNIHTLPGHLFANQFELLHLDLSYNRLLAVHGDLFRSLDKLERLDLSRNRITRIPEDAFKNTEGLRELWLEHNEITSVTRNYFRGANLEKLSIAHNPIHLIETGVFKAQTSLKYLDLSNCHVTVIPQRLFDGPPLQTLKLAHNDITSIDYDAFVTLEHCYQLDLSGNHLRNLDNGLFNGLTNLLHLDLSSNKILNVDSHVFAQQPNLRTLNVSGNEIHEFPAGVFGATQLATLDISGLMLRGFDFDVGKHLVNITVDLGNLDALYNHMSELPALRYVGVNVNGNMTCAKIKGYIELFRSGFDVGLDSARPHYKGDNANGIICNSVEDEFTTEQFTTEQFTRDTTEGALESDLLERVSQIVWYNKRIFRLVIVLYVVVILALLRPLFWRLWKAFSSCFSRAGRDHILDDTEVELLPNVL